MKEAIVHEGDKSYLYLSVPHNISYAFISRSGKSLVFRCSGTYIKSNGEVIGGDVAMTNYISKRIKSDASIISGHDHLGQRDVFRHEFYHDGILTTAIKLRIHKKVA